MNTRPEAAPVVFERTEGLRSNYGRVGVVMEMMRLPGWGELMTKVLPLLHPAEAVPTQLRDLYGSLISPLLEMNGQMSNAIGIEVAPFGSTLAKLTQATIDYTYSLRFCNGILERFQDNDENSYLIVATDAYLPSIVWGTLRVSWGPSIDIFELFSVEPEGQGSKRSQRNKAGSFGRMALHPIFDNLGSLKTSNDLALFNAARIELVRGLMRAGLAVLKDKSLDQVYFIASETRHLWLSMCGVQSRSVEGAVVAKTLTVADLRHRYPGYWQDHPMLFELIEWELASI